MDIDPLAAGHRISSEKLLKDIRGQVLCMGLNRPEKRNAFDLDLYRELSLAYGELHRNPKLRCGVVYAKGDHFTAGLDLPAWADYFSKGQFPELPESGMDPLGLDPDRQVGKPVVMAVQEVTSPDACLEKALFIADTISRQAPLGVGATLRSCRLARDKGDQAAIDRLLPDLMPLMTSRDVQEGLASFLERREARFKGY